MVYRRDPAVWPPSYGMTAPDMYADALDDRNSARPAMSDSLPKRPACGMGVQTLRVHEEPLAFGACPAAQFLGPTHGDAGERKLLAGLVVGGVAGHLGREDARRDTVHVNACTRLLQTNGTEGNVSTDMSYGHKSDADQNSDLGW